MSLDAVNDAIRARRVVRKMTNAPIPSTELEIITRSAHFASNAGNRRIQKMIVVEDARTLRLLKMVSPGMLPQPQAAIAICLDYERAAEFRMDPQTPGLHVDVGTLAATIMLAAYGRDIGSCPVASFSRAAASRILELPPTIDPRLIMCLGYAAAVQPAAFSVIAGNSAETGGRERVSVPGDQAKGTPMSRLPARGDLTGQP